MATLSIFLDFNICGFPLPKLNAWISQNFQDMLTETRSRADQVLVGIRQQLLPWQHFQYFWILTFVGFYCLNSMHGFHKIFKIC